MKRAVVIGAGPAGIAAATTLSRDPGRQVLLIDAGRSPITTALRWPLLGDRTRTVYEGGSGLGGGALVNGLLLGPDRGPIDDIDSRTESVGPLGAVLAEVLATTTPVRLLDPEPGGSVAAALGLSSEIRRHIDVIAATRVYRILFDRHNRVNGVVTDRGTFAADEVLLAAGAIRTPLLLIDSGVRAVGLGEGLHDHPALTISLPVPQTGDGRVSAGRAIVSAVAPLGEPVVPGASSTGPSRFGAAGMLYALERFAAPPGPPRRGLLLALLNSERSGRVFRDRRTGAPVVDLGSPIDGQRILALWSQLVPLLQTAGLGGLLADATIDQWGTSWREIEHGETDNALSKLGRALGGLYHAAGTCATAVESGGAVRGYAGLFVADISQLERSPVWPMRSSIDCGRSSALAALAIG